ncbi:MAG: hypothetical protein AAGD25_28535 [Cyanobacteria bacterium P01_F01_bin.150]
MKKLDGQSDRVWFTLLIDWRQRWRWVGDRSPVLFCIHSFIVGMDEYWRCGDRPQVPFSTSIL